MSRDYDPAQVEPKWQKRWEEAKVSEVDLRKAKNPYYSLVMFPYPSGEKLHVGHWYNFGPADSYARFMRMRGKDVFEPMGFDAFGLPAENYAVKSGIHPAKSTSDNVRTMITQLKRIGCLYDWSKSLDTSQPEYYRWTQWVFLKMYEHGLAYKKEGNVNFCPSCQTVLANEQVWDGKCERCETEVIQKPLEQWFWKITDYAERLLEGHSHLDWPEKTILMQQNWIGRKEGINISYGVEGVSGEIVCFTTRPDTNFGATFIVLAPEHSFVKKILSGALSPPQGNSVESIRTYVETAAQKTELQRQEEGRLKTGVFTGFNAINNLNGVKLPIWVGDFVLSTVGTGAVVGVPGHDTRDFEFAKAFDLPIVRVVVASDGDTSPVDQIEQVQETEGTMINSEFLDGLDIHEATQAVMDHLERKGWGKRVISYRLRDWLISRQRYWGAPIPIVYDPEDRPHPVPEKHLPWLLPTDVEFKPTGRSPLFYSKEFRERTERMFGKGWTPEFDTMDTFVDSSFYFLRFLMEGDQERFVDPELERMWLPVHMYIGGPEHACMHLIYARFVMMALHDFGIVSHDEPFQRLVHQGLITNKGAKMSKSRGNVVSPDAFIEKHGSDVFRMYLMFMGPFTDGGDWSDTGIKGIDRFVQRVWNVFGGPEKFVQEDGLQQGLHALIKRVTDDLERLHFNTAISALMEFLNLVEESSCSQETAQVFTRLLTPLAPHLAEELWETLGGRGFVIGLEWPTYDPKLLRAETITIPIQVNGKVRGEIEIASDASENDVLAKAKEHPNVRKYVEGRTLRKELYVAGKLVSFVV